MPRYSIDTDDGYVFTKDEAGFTLPSAEEACIKAIDALPDMAREKIPDGDPSSVIVIVRDERHTLYSATLTFQGEWKQKRSR